MYLTFLLGYNFSVAVWVGFIALYGLAVQTGVVMVVYLHEALDRRLLAHGEANADRSPSRTSTMRQWKGLCSGCGRK